MTNQSEQSSSGSLGSVLLVSVVAAILSSAMTAYVVTNWLSTAHADVPFVVLDSGRLLDASVRALQQQEFASDDVLVSAARFSDALKQSTARFADAGYVVINRGAVVDYDPRLDITEVVAHEIGLDLQ